MVRLIDSRCNPLYFDQTYFPVIAQTLGMTEILMNVRQIITEIVRTAFLNLQKLYYRKDCLFVIKTEIKLEESYTILDSSVKHLFVAIITFIPALGYFRYRALKKAAEINEIFKNFDISYLCYTNSLAPEDIKLIDRCKLLEHSTFSKYLLICHKYGIRGYEKNDERAFHYAQVAAKQTENEDMMDADLLLQLASFHEKGIGTSVDLKKAVYYVRKAALVKVSAKLQLAKWYDEGIGVAKNEQMATAWYQLASENGFENASLAIAARYIEGKGIEKDIPKGVKMIEELHEKGVWGAGLYLGEFYRFGLHGYPKDRDKAYDLLEWYSNENPAVQAELEKIREEIRIEEEAAAAAEEAARQQAEEAALQQAAGQQQESVQQTSKPQPSMFSGLMSIIRQRLTQRNWIEEA